MPIERETIGEPGLKVRVPTKSMAAFVTYGQPAAHFINGLLWFDPALRAGLKSGSQAFEWLKFFEEGESLPEYIMVGDFETSTDYIQHESGRVMMDALLDACNISSRYVRNYFKLLLSPRWFINRDGDRVITTAGSLMGEPGTKTVLTFGAKTANVKARGGGSSEHFATSGDDQIDADDDPEQLLGYAEAARVTSMRPSFDKWGIYRYAAVYCQEGLIINEPANLAKIDFPKLRLLSKEQKQGKGDEDTNPSFGKAREIRSTCRHVPTDMETTHLLRDYIGRFLRNFSKYIEMRPELFLPIEWGGLGLPGVPYATIWPLLSEWKRSLILEREDGSMAADRILSSWGRPLLMERGLSEEDLAAREAYRELLLSSVWTITTDELRGRFPDGTSFPQMVSLSRRQGILNLEEVIDKIVKSQSYQDFWNPDFKEVSRGFQTYDWSKRDVRLRKAFSDNFVIRERLEPCPEGPKWSPAVFVNTTTEYFLQCDDASGSESGWLPLLGEAEPGPRVFLHLRNERLGRTGHSSDQHLGTDTIAYSFESGSPTRKRKRVAPNELSTN
jgi:hypothetical protein